MATSPLPCQEYHMETKQSTKGRTPHMVIRLHDVERSYYFRNQNQNWLPHTFLVRCTQSHRTKLDRHFAFSAGKKRGGLVT